MNTTAAEIQKYIYRLWPIMRSITGDGVRESLGIISEIVDMEIVEVPTGTRVLDWVVPKEWVIRDAYIIRPDGKKILDIHDNNLHIVNYSIPFKGKISKTELENHLHSLPEMPEAIPYITSYYVPRWGFCISHNERLTLPDGEYEVYIDAEHIDGSLTYGEAVLPGKTDKEILLSTYVCHPSLGNNELSGPVVAAFLHRELASIEDRRYTYRFLFCPETIGSIAFLSKRGDYLRKKLHAGYVVTCVGDNGPFTYKRSRRGDTTADRAAEYVLKVSKDTKYVIKDFFPVPGSDERQYCSPGFNLPVGSLMRTMYGQYNEYHTSLDNLQYISISSMLDSIRMYLDILICIEYNGKYLNIFPEGEPQLIRRKIFPKLSDELKSFLWVLNYSDGNNDLLEISNKSGISLDSLYNTALKCLRAGILHEIED